jgi:hypothetical protein
VVVSLIVAALCLIGALHAMLLRFGRRASRAPSVADQQRIMLARSILALRL